MVKRKEDIEKKNNFLFYESPKIKLLVNEQFKTQEEISQDANLISKNIREKLGEEHPFEYKIIRELAKKFGLINAVVDKYIDFVVGPGIYIECKDGGAKEILNQWIERTNFNLYLSRWLKQALLVGSSYLEVAGLSDKSKDNKIKIVNADTIYIVRDNKGNITNINQYIGNNLNLIDVNNINNLNKDEIIQFNFNILDNSAYGYGLVYSAMNTVNDFLMAQKAMHNLLKRKANSPIHVKLGNAEKDDYPEQDDIDAYGEKLQYINEQTEWVSGPNVEMKILDFGDVGEKFISALENDYKLLSYSFQIPEVILGSGRIPEGLADVQLKTFDRRIVAIQKEFAYVIKEKILRKVLYNSGVDVNFDIIWGENSEEDIHIKMEKYSNLIANQGISYGLKVELEKQLANILDIDYDVVESSNDEHKKEVEQMVMQNNTEHPEKKKEEKEPLPEVPGQKSKEYLKGKYALESCHCKHCTEEAIDFTKDYTVKEWTNINISDLKKQIFKAIKKDEFTDLSAINKIEELAGYYDKNEINKMKKIFEEAFASNKSVKWIEQEFEKNDLTKNLYAYDSNGLLEKNGEKILVVEGKFRNNVIARTETVRLANEGALEQYKNAKVEEVRLSASLSDRTCDECMSLNGQIYNINEATGVVPIHPMCRCTMIPIVQGLS